ncbi:MAG: indolepyruvate ferredoxin oxidoreductase [Synergistaceae bacterium]|nr:indolepyruvate ferredoxin oxidoreductase [Synergistaceae bacterium]
MQYVIVGIGGQGILFTSRVLGKIALDRGVEVIGSEVHGMAQRGGSVVSHFKIGDYQSPLVQTGEADVLLAFDQGEGIRNLSFLKDGGSLVVNIHDEKAFENPNLKEYLKKRHIKVHSVKGYDLLREHMGGNFLFLNVLLAGAMCASGVTDLAFDEVATAVKDLSPTKFEDANQKVLQLGYEAQ